MTTTTAKEDIALMAHLLRRAGFGASYDEVEHYAAKGYAETVEELLHPEDQPPIEEDFLLRLQPGWGDLILPETNMIYWVYRMMTTNSPLEEKIALFWHGVHCTGDCQDRRSQANDRHRQNVPPGRAGQLPHLTHRAGQRPGHGLFPGQQPEP